MRNILLYLMAVIIVQASCFAAEETSFSQYAPDDTLLFAEVSGLQNVWNDLRATNFQRRFVALKMWNEFGLPASIRNFADEFKTMTGFALSESNIMALAGQRAAMCIYAEPDSMNGPVGIEVVLLFQTSPKITAEEIIASIDKKTRAEFGNNAWFSDVTHSGRKIYSLKPKDQSVPIEIRYTFDNNILLFGFGNIRPRIESFLDCADGKADSLKKFPQYAKTRTITAPLNNNPFIMAYANTSRLGEIKESAGTDGLDILNLIDGLFDCVGPEGHAGITLSLEKGIRIRTIGIPASGSMPVSVPAKSPARRETPESLNYVPANTVLYLAMNSITQDIAGSENDVEENREEVFSRLVYYAGLLLNTDMQDDFSALGIDDAFIISTGFGEEIPVPRIAFALKTGELNKAAGFGDKLIRAICGDALSGDSTEFKSIRHEGLTIRYIETNNPVEKASGTFKPCWTMADRYLIVSSSLDLVKSMIDVSKGRKIGLMDSVSYRRAGIPLKADCALLLDGEGMNNAVRSGLDWFLAHTAAGGIGDPAKKIAENHLLPVIDLLGAVKSVSFYSHETPQGRETNLHIMLEDLPGI